MPRYDVTITRWDTYRVREVEAATSQEAEERALEMFDEVECEHVDGGVNSVHAEEAEL